MDLCGKQREKLRHALIDAFPEKIKLEQMLDYQLEKNLDAIAGGDNLKDVVFKLIKTADAEGWVEDLIYAAQQENPSNPKLKVIAEEIKNTYSKNRYIQIEKELRETKEELITTKKQVQQLEKEHKELLQAYAASTKELKKCIELVEAQNLRAADQDKVLREIKEELARKQDLATRDDDETEETRSRLGRDGRNSHRPSDVKDEIKEMFKIRGLDDMRTR